MLTRSVMIGAMENWGDYAELVGLLLITFFLGLLSRPWVDWLIRHERRSEEDRIYWTPKAARS